MRAAALVFTLLALVAVASAQTSTKFTTYFTGGLPFCTQCGTVGQYACSPDANGVTLGNWNNGVVSFSDPIPSGNYATSFTVAVYGAFSCNALTGSRVMFGLSLNSNVFGVRDSGKGVNQCRCDTCDGNEMFTFNFRNGVPGYRYRTTNSLKFEIYKDSLCVNRIEVTINYSPILSSPPTPLPEFYVPLTIPKEYDRIGCSVCNGGLNQWCSASNNNSLQLTFKDPLPSSTYLVSIDAYLSLNLIEKAYLYSTTLSATVMDTSIGTLTISESGWKEKCGCLSDHSISSATYQRGWPGYLAGGINRIVISVSKYSQTSGNVCIGRLHLKLVYFSYAENGEKEYHTMMLDNLEVE